MNEVGKLSDKLQKKIYSLAFEEKSKYNLNAIKTAEEKEQLKQNIKKLLQEKNAQIIAHFYVADELQQLADETGGIVADSLDMAHFGTKSNADILVVCGVRFMGETAKILSPEKTIIMPDLEATCSLDLGCVAEDFAEFCAQYPEYEVVVYANTSAEVKAIADWVVTSSNALDIVAHLKSQGKKIIWAPDKHLGNWIQDKTGIEMLIWQGHCVVHDEFNFLELKQLKLEHPEAVVLVHPESAESVVAMADVVGSTKVLINSVEKINADCFIVATDAGIFHKMQQIAPHKKLIIAPTTSKEMQCKICATCPWMAMNDLENLEKCLRYATGEILLEDKIIKLAKNSINKMLNFSYSCGVISNEKN